MAASKKKRRHGMRDANGQTVRKGDVVRIVTRRSGEHGYTGHVMTVEHGTARVKTDASIQLGNKWDSGTFDSDEIVRLPRTDTYEPVPRTKLQSFWQSLFGG